MSRKILCVDFDGVIHSYTSGWKGVDNIPDQPVRGALQWIRSVLENEEYAIYIYSSRSKDPEGIEAMKAWLLHNGLEAPYLNLIEFPDKKPPAYLTIDDRAITFRGTFPSKLELDNFRPWNK